MKLNDLTTHVRQRSAWEAVDLGFTLVQHNWRSLYVPWALLALLLATCTWIVLPENYIWVATLACWWLKPVYDRVLLHILSHSLFGRQLSTAEVFSAIPGLLRNTGLLSALTFRRFSPSRSYALPIWQLEGLRGKERKQRQELLSLQGHSHAVWLSIACVNLEWILILSLYALLLMLDPSGQVWEHLKSIFSGGLDMETQYWQSMLDYAFYMLAVVVIEPFFVAAGFSLYLNRRTQLEAWDLEISFRNLGERLQSTLQTASHTAVATVLGLLLGLAVASSPAPLHAAGSDEYLADHRLPASEVAAQIQEVMKAEELAQRRKITTWIPRDKTEKQQENQQLSGQIIQMVSLLLKTLLWVAVLVGLALAVIYRQRILALLTPAKTRQQVQEKPAVLFGLDIRPESLPADIASSARQLWQAGKPREALSLLYRGALMLLTRKQSVPIQDSDTEGDILRLMRPALSGKHYEYLRHITRHWQSIAYAHRAPNSTEFESLLAGWPDFQQGQAATPSAGQPT